MHDIKQGLLQLCPNHILYLTPIAANVHHHILHDRVCADINSFYGTGNFYGMHLASDCSMVLPSKTQNRGDSAPCCTILHWYQHDMTYTTADQSKNHLLFYLHFLTSPHTITSERISIHIWNRYLHSCGILCTLTCCFLHTLRWCTGLIFKGQRSRKQRSTNVIRSLITPNI